MLWRIILLKTTSENYLENILIVKKYVRARSMVQVVELLPTQR
jgi:hypothetical protein